MRNLKYQTNLCLVDREAEKTAEKNTFKKQQTNHNNKKSENREHQAKAEIREAQNEDEEAPEENCK